MAGAVESKVGLLHERSVSFLAVVGKKKGEAGLTGLHVLELVVPLQSVPQVLISARHQEAAWTMSV